jgi:hypothetical protein
METSQDVLHEHTTTTTQLDQPKRFINVVCKRIHCVHFRRLQKDRDPSCHHFSKEGGYLRSSDEISILRKDILLPIVTESIISKGLLPIIGDTQLAHLPDLLYHHLSQLVWL